MSPISWLPGDIESFPPPQGWPYDLADEALLESLEDRAGTPRPRIEALVREARRRGLRVKGPPQASQPEVIRRR